MLCSALLGGTMAGMAPARGGMPSVLGYSSYWHPTDAPKQACCLLPLVWLSGYTPDLGGGAGRLHLVLSLVTASSLRHCHHNYRSKKFGKMSSVGQGCLMTTLIWMKNRLRVGGQVLATTSQCLFRLPVVTDVPGADL